MTGRVGDLCRIHFAKIFGVIGDGGEIEWPADIVLLAKNRDGFAAREAIGIGGRKPRAADIGVERIGRVDVRFTKIGVFERGFGDAGFGGGEVGGGLVGGACCCTTGSGGWRRVARREQRAGGGRKQDCTEHHGIISPIAGSQRCRSERIGDIAPKDLAFEAAFGAEFLDIFELERQAVAVELGRISDQRAGAKDARL